MSSKNEIFGAFFGQFPFGSLVFFILQTQLSPLVLDRPFGASPDPGPFMELTRHWVGPRKPCEQKGGCLRYREFLVQMWRIRTWWRSWWSQHHWDHFLRQKMVIFFGGKDGDYCEKPRLAMKIRTVWVRARMLFMVLTTAHSETIPPFRNVEGKVQKSRSSSDLLKYSYHNCIHKKTSSMILGEVDFVGQIFPFFFWAWKKHTTIPVSGGQNAAAGGHPLHSSRALGQDG